MKTPFLPLPCRSFETHTQSFQLASPVTVGTFLLNDLNLISQFAVQDQSPDFSPCIISKLFLLFLILHSRLQPPSGQAKLLNLFLFSVSAVWTNILAAEGSEVIRLSAHERYHGVHAKETGRASGNSMFPLKACKTLEPGKAASSARAMGSQKEQLSIFPLSTNHIIKP